MQGGEGADRVMGLFINTLPVRLDLDDDGGGGQRRGRRTRVLAELLRHEHASLALAQRCSGVAAPAPLFTALLNYRHSGAPAARTMRAAAGIAAGVESAVGGEERTNYPLTLSVDDLGDGFGSRLDARRSSTARAGAGVR